MNVKNILKPKMVVQKIDVEFYGATRQFKIIYSDENNYSFHEINPQNKVYDDPLVNLFGKCWMGDLVNEEMIETFLTKEKGDIFEMDCIYQDDDKDIVVNYVATYKITDISVYEGE